MRQEIDRCLEVLQSGGLILYPTDTVWGLGCDATNPDAVQKIYNLKQREASKSLIVLVNNDAMLNRHVKEVPAIAWDVLDLSTTPTTIIYPDAQNLASNVIGEDRSIAIRMINTPFCQQLIAKFKKPIVSTSANISNEPTPLHWHEISQEIIDGVEYMVDKELDHGTKKPSALMKIEVNGEVKIFRK